MGFILTKNQRYHTIKTTYLRGTEEGGEDPWRGQGRQSGVRPTFKNRVSERELGGHRAEQRGKERIISGTLRTRASTDVFVSTPGV